MKINKICFLAGDYPTSESPKAAVFYQNFVHQVAKMGIECRVIFPYPINLNNGVNEKERVDIVDEEHSVKVYRPNCVTLGAKKIGKWNSAYLTSLFYTYSARKALENMKWKPDAFYGHFISPAGIMTAKLSKEMGMAPAFIAYGESQPWSINTIGVKRTQSVLSMVSGFIAVSSKNMNELIDLRIATKERVKVFPNGVDTNVFYKRNKAEARRKMGWGMEKFIVAFVGHFNERKGVLRLDEALSNKSDIYVAYAGSGELTPKAANTIYSANITPDLMPWFLSAADIFVLPTLHEGCCNAVIEALACGLPIISSDRDFNYDVLSAKNAILIDPESVDDIGNAIMMLKNNEELRNRLGSAAIETAKNLKIEERAKDIMSWMEEAINQQNSQTV